MKVLVIVPTYDERDNIAPLARAVLRQDEHIDLLIIDDNSPDGTGSLADDLASQSPRIHVIHRPGKLGLGTASIRGLCFAREHEYDHAILMDADFSHDPDAIPQFLRYASSYDLVIGSRYIPGGRVENWGWSRKLASFLTNVSSRLLLRIPAHDVTGAYKCFRVARLRELDLDHFLSRGFSFQEEIAMRCARAGWRMKEVPITFVDRTVGKSKASVREALGSLLTIALLPFSRR